MGIDLRACRASLAPIGLAWAVGCGTPAPTAIDIRGAEMIGRLPASVRDQVPPRSVLRFEERGEGGAYSLQILHESGGERLATPKKKPTGWEQHRMPATALEGLLATKLPSFPLGQTRESRCLLTHWRDPDGAEIQVREIVTDQGWFASVERVVP